MCHFFVFFFFNDPATPEIYTLSLHDAPPISDLEQRATSGGRELPRTTRRSASSPRAGRADRKSTRLNSSHGYISYAVFCLKKKKKNRDHNSESTNNMHTREHNPASMRQQDLK